MTDAPKHPPLPSPEPRRGGFAFVWACGLASSVPLALTAFESRFEDPYVATGLPQTFALGFALGLLIWSLRCGVEPREAVHRMTIGLVGYGITVTIPALIWIEAHSNAAGWNGVAWLLAGGAVVSTAAWLGTLASLRLQSPRWRALTVIVALTSAIPIAFLIVRPIVSLIALMALRIPDPFDPALSVPEALMWRAWTPSYAQACDTAAWVLPGLAFVALAVSRTRTQRFRPSLLILLIGYSCWPLFGFETVSLNQDPILLRRTFGRGTVLHAFDSRLEVQRSHYSWQRPFDRGHYLAACSEPPVVVWLDSDSNGRWDVWHRTVTLPPPEGCGTEYQVDTTGKGSPDWVFTLPPHSGQEAMKMIKERRGF